MSPQPVETTTQDHFIKSTQAKGVELYIRERLPNGAQPRDIKSAALCVHGTFNPGAGFDCSAPGFSWLQDLAASGKAAYFMDLRGYGRSTAPLPTSGSEPVCTIDDAVQDIHDAVTFICDRLDLPSINLVGFSWGTTTTARYAQLHPDQVRKLLMLAPLTHGGVMAHTEEEPVTPDAAAKIFGRGFKMLCDPTDPKKFNPAIRPFTQWSLTDTRRHDAAAMGGLDPSLWQVPEASRAALEDLRRHTNTTGDLITSPSGAAYNLFQFYVLGRELFDPAAVHTPVLIVRGDRDFASTGPETLDLLSQFGSRQKAFLEVGNAGHGVFRHRAAPLLFALSKAFFDD